MSQLSKHLQENPGADFVVAFILALLIVALVYPLDGEIANKIASFAFLSLVAGVVLQVLALGRTSGQGARVLGQA